MEFEQKQLEHFPLETDLPLKTIKIAFEASLEKEDPVTTAEMLLIYADYVKKVFLKSPLSILKDVDIDKNNNNNIDDNLKKAWRIADLYDKDARIMWYLLIAWFLDIKNKKVDAEKTLNALFKKDLIAVNDDYCIVNFLISNLYVHYKDNLAKIFNYLSDCDIYRICLFFIVNNEIEKGLEILIHIKNIDTKIYDLIKELNSIALDISYLPFIETFGKYHDFSFSYGAPSKPYALSYIALFLAKYNRLDESSRLFDYAIKSTKELDIFNRPNSLRFIAMSLAHSNKFDDAIKLAKELDLSHNKSYILSKIIMMELDINKSYRKEELEIIDTYTKNYMYDIISRSLQIPKDLWNSLINLSLGYPEISYSVCSLLAKRYPEKASEIADLILKYNFYTA